MQKQHPDSPGRAALRQYRLVVLLATGILWVFMAGFNREWWGGDAVLFTFFLVGGIPAYSCSPFAALGDALGGGSYVVQLVYSCAFTCAALVYYGVVFRPLRHKLWSRPEDRSDLVLRQSCHLLVHFAFSGLLGYFVVFSYRW